MEDKKDPWLDKWDQRYSANDFAYGILPNDYLQERLETLEPGAILFAAEGEGRNAVFAAGRGWNVSAFDISEEGKKKAFKLAGEKSVSIEYSVGELGTIVYNVGQFDAIALIYAHFPANKKSLYHKMLGSYLRKGGFIIFEAFSKKHLSYNSINGNVGGPTQADMLFSIEEIKSDFPDYEVIELSEKEIVLSEGSFHNGTGSVIRFFARKK